MLLSLLLVPLPISFLAWSFLSVDRKSQQAVRELLARGQITPETGEQKTSGVLESIGYRLTPGSYVQKLDRLLALAGRPPSLPLGRVLAAKPALGLCGALLGLFMSSNSSSG